MTLILELTPELEARLQANAAQAGQAPADYVRGWLEQLPDTSSTDAASLLDLFQQWKEETAQMPSDEQTKDSEKWDEVMQNLQSNRTVFLTRNVSDYD